MLRRGRKTVSVGSWKSGNAVFFTFWVAEKVASKRVFWWNGHSGDVGVSWLCGRLFGGFWRFLAREGC